MARLPTIVLIGIALDYRYYWALNGAMQGSA